MTPPGVERRLPIDIEPQPDLTSCGPTCLQAIYRYHGEDDDLDAIRQRVDQIGDGGTLAVMLAIDALRRGYGATIHTFNLTLFDPTWFQGTAPGDDPQGQRARLIERLERQAATKPGERLRAATGAYVEFLRLGGQLTWGDLTEDVLRDHLGAGTPLLTGLSSTYLYQEAREVQSTMVADDVAGEPTGHFVILSGYDPEGRCVRISDPLEDNPVADEQHYLIPVERVICSILLGVLTYDANFLIIEPPRSPLKNSESSSTTLRGPGLRCRTAPHSSLWGEPAPCRDPRRPVLLNPDFFGRPAGRDGDGDGAEALR